MPLAAFRTTLVSVFVSAVLVGAPAPAANLGAIAGQVTDESGHPIGDAAITITSRRLEKEGRRIATEWDGYFRFPDLPAGRYALRAEKAGFGVFVREDVVVKELDSTTVEVAMSTALAPPVPAAVAPPEEAPESPAPVAAEPPVTPGPPVAAEPLASPGPPVAAAPPAVPGAGPSYKVKRRTFVGTVLAFNPRVVLVDLGMGREVKVHVDGGTEIEGEITVGCDVRVHAPVDTTSYRVATSIKVLD
jgi:hypothetical protein